MAPCSASDTPALYSEFPTLSLVCHALCARNFEVNGVSLNDIAAEKQSSVFEIGNLRIFAEYLSNEKMYELQHSHGVHLCPSSVEGFGNYINESAYCLQSSVFLWCPGHYINEARALSRLILTTDYPPMSELVDRHSGIMITAPKAVALKKSLGMAADVTAGAIADAVQTALALSIKERTALGQNASARFVSDSARFRDNFAKLVNQVPLHR